MVVDLFITAGIGLALASALYLGPRAPSLWIPVLLLIMLVSLGASVASGGLGRGPLGPLWHFAGSFIPIATVYLAYRSRRPMYQGAIYSFGFIYTLGQPLMYSAVTIGMLVAFAATRPRRELWKVLLFPAAMVINVIVAFAIRTTRLGWVFDRLDGWRPGDSPLEWSWQVDRYLDALSGAAPFGAGTVQLVPQAGRAGWFIALTAHLGIVPAIVIVTVLALTFWRITLHSVRLIRQRPHAFVLAATLLPLLAVSLAVQLGLLPVFGVAPPPFNTMASGPLWLVLALCATRWPVLPDVNARTLRPRLSEPHPGRAA
ncbi:hypothetical protein [Microbacterium testaceum]|uniref:hypothetical protein n=1 Tax=Microbacterium testaceum TaxID=2033 RepID=UPI002AC54234|nr:hypothetical protein [Microbacterium testaceum]MDZ5146117.1 hypothetical protein [Microbacterium testaceum]